MARHQGRGNLSFLSYGGNRRKNKKKMGGLLVFQTCPRAVWFHNAKISVK